MGLVFTEESTVEADKLFSEPLSLPARVVSLTYSRLTDSRLIFMDSFTEDIRLSEWIRTHGSKRQSEPEIFWENISSSSLSSFQRFVPWAWVGRTFFELGLLSSIVGVEASDLYATPDVPSITKLDEQKDSDAYATFVARTRTPELSLPVISSLNFDGGSSLTPPTQGTCGWLLSHETYMSWKAGGTILNLVGPAGSGKITLSSAVMCELLHECDEDDSIAAASFHFDFGDPNKQQARDIALAVLKQLFWRNLANAAEIEALYASRDTNGRATSEMDRLLVVIKELTQRFRIVYILIDGFDQGAPYLDLHSFISSLVLHASQSGNLGVFVSSQDTWCNEDMKTLLGQSSCTNSSSETCHADMSRYIAERFQKDEGLLKWWSHPQACTEAQHRLLQQPNPV